MPRKMRSEPLIGRLCNLFTVQDYSVTQNLTRVPAPARHSFYLSRMNVNEEMLNRLAALARLDIAPERKPALIRDLQKMLDFVEQLREVDAEGVPPMVSPCEAPYLGNADIPEPPLEREPLLRQAPDREGPYFRIPKVVDKDS